MCSLRGSRRVLLRVATDVGDVARIVGDDGLIVPSGDQAGLTRALYEALTHFERPPRPARETRTVETYCDELLGVAGLL